MFNACAFELVHIRFDSINLLSAITLWNYHMWILIIEIEYTMNFKHKIVEKNILSAFWAYFTQCIIRRYNITLIYIRENRNGNLQWTLQRHLHHRVHKTQHTKRQKHTQKQHNTEYERMISTNPNKIILRIVSSPSL